MNPGKQRFSPWKSVLLCAALAGSAALAGCGGGGAAAPPIDNPPIDNPPIDNPPIDNPPIDNPPPVDDRPVDVRLAEAYTENGMHPIDPGADASAEQVELGRMLFFDKEISGNRDISCSACHHVNFKSADGIPLAIGTGGFAGIGPDRLMGEGRTFIPRHSTDIFNRGLAEWETFFWDGRLQGNPTEGFSSPEVGELPPGLSSVLAAQTMVTSMNRREMRGEQSDSHGFNNELAPMSDASPEVVWDSVMTRLLRFPGYRALFSAAFPETPGGDFTYVQAANALAAFQDKEFTFLDTPFDRYVKGDLTAISAEAKEGAVLFYGKANCASCHAGALFTDQEAHNVGVPQLGPGINGGRDYGLAGVTHDSADLYSFRTPPLRNVTLTGPYMHNGSLTTLEQVVKHHLNPQGSLTSYTGEDLPEELKPLVASDQTTITDILSTLDPEVANPTVLTQEEIDQVLAFLDTLTDTAANDLTHIPPTVVPSEVPIGYY